MQATPPQPRFPDSGLRALPLRPRADGSRARRASPHGRREGPRGLRAEEHMAKNRGAPGGPALPRARRLLLTRAGQALPAASTHASAHPTGKPGSPGWPPWASLQWVHTHPSGKRGPSPLPRLTLPAVS